MSLNSLEVSRREELFVDLLETFVDDFYEVDDDYELTEEDAYITSILMDYFVENYKQITLKEASVEVLTNTSFNVKVINSTFTKLSLLHKIIEPNNILTVFTSDTINYNIDDDIYNMIKKLYRCSKSKPTDKEEYILLITTMIKHLTYKDLIETDVKKSNKTRTYTYSLNEEYLKHHIELDKYANNNYVNYDEYIKTRYNLFSQEIIEDGFNVDLDTIIA